MTPFSYKEFMAGIVKRLSELSHAELVQIIVERAEQTPASGRKAFLDTLTLPEMKRRAVSDTLIEEIDAFAQRVEEGEYCEGWGWDEEIREERDWGDESWASEMDDFFGKARDLLFEGNAVLAEKAYVKLFDILAMGQEPGHLPGNPDFSLLLESDLDEQLALFLQAIYRSAPAAERSELLYQAIDDYGYLSTAPGLSLQQIVNACVDPLPDYECFLNDWIAFLTEHERSGSKLLREAILLRGGNDALAKFAREHAERHPQAYIDWLEALEKQEAALDERIDAAEEALAAIPTDYIVRAQAGLFLARLGEQFGDREMKLKGYEASFYSDPSIRGLLDVYLAAIECGKLETVRDRVEERISAIRFKKWSGSSERERATSTVREGLVQHADLFGGRYDRVYSICQGKEALGWSWANHPILAFSAFSMVALAGKAASSTSLMLYWEYAIRYTEDAVDASYIEKYKKVAAYVMEEHLFTKKQEEVYLQWCTDITGQRVDAIVSNQHRGSYWKAAAMLAGMADVFVCRGVESEGRQLLATYMTRYPRHSAFKSELAAAGEKSLISGVK